MSYLGGNFLSVSYEYQRSAIAGAITSCIVVIIFILIAVFVKPADLNLGEKGFYAFVIFGGLVGSLFFGDVVSIITPLSKVKP